MRHLLMGLVATLVVMVAPAVAGAYSTSPDFKATDFVTGLPSVSSIGPIGLAWDGTRHLYVADYANGLIYRFDAAGGAAAGHELNLRDSYGARNATGLAFTKSGRLYLALQASNKVVEISPANGTRIRDEAAAACATALATDPLSGDLFVTDPCPGSATRIHDPDSAAPSSALVPLAMYWDDGLTFGPDGTSYGTEYGYAVQINVPTSDPRFGTNAGHRTINIGYGMDGMAVSVPTATTPSHIYANRNDGTVLEIDPATGHTRTIFSGGSRGDFTTVGPDGCLYITQSDRIVKITDANGGCPFAPTTALPVLNASPATQSPHVGQAATITATLSNVADAPRQTVFFEITGANPQTLSAVTDANGVATLTYHGAAQGLDHVLAYANVGGVNAQAASVDVDWLEPLDTTPPVIVPTLDGTAGNDGWYVSPVTVSFAVSDPETGVATTSGCDTVTFPDDTAGVSVMCTATNGVGLTSSDTEKLRIDQTAPSVAYTGNAGTYDVDEAVAIGCSANDALSGVVSSTCADVTGPAWSFGAGIHTVSATATDDAGNTGRGSATFTVVVTENGLCDLVQQWSSKPGVATSLCTKLSAAAAADGRGHADVAENELQAFRNEVAAQRGKALAEAQADELMLLSESL